jgi:diguanylate cyclase (GGDEF)-like protein
MLPFGFVAALGLALVPVPGQRYDTGLFLAACGLTALVAALALLAPWQRLSPALRVLPALLYLLSVALLRHSLGGAVGGVGTLVLLPVVWLALYGTGRQLLVLLAGVAAVYAIPMLLIGGVAYPASGWRMGVLQVVLAGIIGATVQRLVRRVRSQAEEARLAAAERARLLAQVEELARTDGLTGIANRRRWQESVRLWFGAEAGAGASRCLALLDLDGFKRLNDAGGHAAGDRVLQAAAAAWQAELRPGDVIARLGGDEFGLLLHDCDLDTAEHVLARLRERTPEAVGVSAGVARWDGVESPEALELRADLLLYEAKRAGGGRTRSAQVQLAG